MSKKTQIHEILVKYENQVWDSFPSIYTKDDIKKMMNKIIIEVGDVLDDTTNNNIDLEDLQQKVILNVVDAIESFDFEDEVELELTYSNQIDITFQSDKIIRSVRESITETFEQFVEVVEEEEVEY
jgi:hypothetical protein